MRRNVIQLAGGCAMILATAGCVERKMTFTTEPSGALVVVSNVEKGRTPLTTDFLWYGDYEVVITKEGYEPLVTHFKVKAPVYDMPPMDLFSDMAPWTYHVDRRAHYTLKKAEPIDDATLLERSEQLRIQAATPIEGE